MVLLSENGSLRSMSPPKPKASKSAIGSSDMSNSASLLFLPLVSGASGSRVGSIDFLSCEVKVIKPFISSAFKNLFAWAGLLYEVLAIISLEVNPSGLTIAVANAFISSGVKRFLGRF